MKQWMVMLLAVGVLLIGCSGGAKETQTPPKEVPPEAVAAPATGDAAKPVNEPAPKVGDLTQREVDAAHSIVVLYLDAVVNQDAALINFLTAGTPAAKAPPVPSGSKSAQVEEIKTVKAIILDGYPTVYVEVKADLGSSPADGWTQGTNLRWAEVQKLKDGWKVKAVTTSPPNG